MNLSTFMQSLYTFAANRYDNQVDFFKDFINNSVNEKTHGFISNTSKGTISKYLNGKLSFSAPARKILANLDKNNLIEYLDTIFYDEDQICTLNDVLNSKKKDDEEDFKFIDVNDIADYFYKLLGIISTKKKEPNSTNDNKSNKSNLADSILNSSPNEIMNILNNTEEQIKLFDYSLNRKIPDPISKDFEYRILRNNIDLRPELIQKNKDALSRHQISFKHHFKNEDEHKLFFRTLQKAEILNKFIEVKSSMVERYIDDFKDEYYDPKRYKQYVGPSNRERPILNVSLSLDNGHFSEHFNKIVLKELEIKDETLTYTNKDENTWFLLKVSFDCSKYEYDKLMISINLGIRKEYSTDIDYLKLYQKCNILMNDNNSHITLTDLNSNKKYMDMDIIGKENYTNDDYKCMKDMFDSLDKLSEIQRIKKTKFIYDHEDFYTYKTTYDLAYACVTNQKYKTKTEIISEIIIPDENLNDYKIGEIKDRTIKMDFIVLFNKKITFKEKTIELKNTETLEICKREGLNIGKIKIKGLEIKEA